MSDTNTEPLDFSIDVSGVSTKYPSLAVGKHQAKITGFTKEAWKKDPSKSSLVIAFALEAPALDTDGNNVNPGYVFRHRLALQQHESEKAPDFRRDIAAMIDAVEGTSDKTGRPAFTAHWCESAVGKSVLVEFRPAKDTQFGDTEVKSLHKLPA